MTNISLAHYWQARGRISEALALLASALVNVDQLRDLLLEIESDLQALRRSELLRD